MSPRLLIIALALMSLASCVATPIQLPNSDMAPAHQDQGSSSSRDGGGLPDSIGHGDRGAAPGSDMVTPLDGSPWTPDGQRPDGLIKDGATDQELLGDSRISDGLGEGVKAGDGLAAPDGLASPD